MTDLGYIGSGFQIWHDLLPVETTRSQEMSKAKASRELMPWRSSAAEPSSMYEIINNIFKRLRGRKAARLWAGSWGRVGVMAVDHKSLYFRA